MIELQMVNFSIIVIICTYWTGNTVRNRATVRVCRATGVGLSQHWVCMHDLGRVLVCESRMNTSTAEHTHIKCKQLKKCHINCTWDKQMHTENYKLARAVNMENALRLSWIFHRRRQKYKRSLPNCMTSYKRWAWYSGCVCKAATQKSRLCLLFASFATGVYHRACCESTGCTGIAAHVQNK